LNTIKEYDKALRISKSEIHLIAESQCITGQVSGPKRDKVTGEWIFLHNEEFNGLYSSPNTVRVIKSRRMRWAGHVARMWEGRGI